MADKKKETPKKDQLTDDRKALNAIMTRTDKQPDMIGLRKCLIMAVRQMDDVISSRKKK